MIKRVPSEGERGNTVGVGDLDVVPVRLDVGPERAPVAGNGDRHVNRRRAADVVDGDRRPVEATR